MGVVDEGNRFSATLELALVGAGSDVITIRQAEEEAGHSGFIYFMDFQMQEPDAAGALTSVEIFWEDSLGAETRVTLRDDDYTASGMRLESPEKDMHLRARFSSGGAARGRIIVSGAYA